MNEVTYDWFDWMEDALTQIETIYSHCSAEVQQELANRFRHLQDVNDDWLDAWLLLQERFHQVTEKYPELTDAEQLTMGLPYVNNVNSGQSKPSVTNSDADEKSYDTLEFWIDEHALHQFRIGQGYYNLWMFPEALDQFLQVMDTEPDFLLGRLYLALTHFQREKWEEAEKEFQLVLKTAPHNEFSRFAYHMLGCVLVKQNQDVKAVRQFSRALEINSENADTLFNLGACHYRLRSIRLAIPCFEQAIMQEPDDWESMLYLARCYSTLGDHEQSTYWRQQSYQTSQKPWIISEIADHFERQGQLDQALAWNMYCVTKHPEWAEGYHGVAWNIWRKDRSPQAVLWLKKALTLKRDDANMQFSYWWITHNVGTPKEKARVDNHLSSVMRQSPLWKLAHGNQYRIKGDLDQAKKTLTPLLNAQEMRVQGAAYYQLAHLYMAEQNWTEAVKHFHAARERDEQLHDTLLFEGICHYLTGDEAQSQNCLRLYQTQQATG